MTNMSCKYDKLILTARDTILHDLRVRQKWNYLKSNSYETDKSGNYAAIFAGYVEFVRNYGMRAQRMRNRFSRICFHVNDKSLRQHNLQLGRVIFTFQFQ